MLLIATCATVVVNETFICTRIPYLLFLNETSFHARETRLPSFLKSRRRLDNEEKLSIYRILFSHPQSFGENHLPFLYVVRHIYALIISMNNPNMAMMLNLHLSNF